MKVIDARPEAAQLSALFYRHIPEMGLRNYWHPIAMASEVGEKPLRRRVMGDDLVLARRQGKVYALANACPHRGSQLAKGTCEFPGSRTITCRYHGWTFDMADGKLIAALTDGPDSPIVGKVRTRAYPVEVRQGIVWIWMAETPPVPVEQDIPPGLLEATVVRTMRRVTRGNWRWHVENPGLGHATMLHRDSAYMRMVDFFGYAENPHAMLGSQGNDGEWLLDRFGAPGKNAHYPGLGVWPRKRFGEVIKIQALMPALRGIDTFVSVKMPGIIRVIHFPIPGALYYEWFVQTDVDHYLYFQVACGYPQTLAQRAWWLARFYAWGRWAGMGQFNGQDIWMVEDSHDKARAEGVNDPAPLYRPDGFQIAWRKYALENLRGVDIPELKAQPALREATSAG